MNCNPQNPHAAQLFVLYRDELSEDFVRRNMAPAVGPVRYEMAKQAIGLIFLRNQFRPTDIGLDADFEYNPARYPALNPDQAQQVDLAALGDELRDYARQMNTEQQVFVFV